MGVGKTPFSRRDGKLCLEWIFFIRGERLRKSVFDHSNVFQSKKQHSVNLKLRLKPKLGWSVCTDSVGGVSVGGGGELTFGGGGIFLGGGECL